MSFGVAVVGLGKMGISHLAILNALPAFRVAAVCDSSMLVGGTVARFGKMRHVPDFDAVLARDDIDCVVIATPTSSHHDMVRRALERDLHVFCEKPLTLSAATSDAIARQAQARKLVGQVGYHNRFVATFAEAKRLLEAGAIGKVVHATAEAYGPVVLRPAKGTWRTRGADGGGCLYDYAAHPINLLNWCLGPVERCRDATLKGVFSGEVDDIVQATLEFGNGVSGQVCVNWSDASARKMTTKISFWGTQGRIFADRQGLQVFLSGPSGRGDGYGPGWTVRNITELTGPVEFYLRGEEYTAQLAAFAAAMRDPQAPCRNDFASAARTDEAIEMIRRFGSGAPDAARGRDALHNGAKLAQRLLRRRA